MEQEEVSYGIAFQFHFGNDMTLEVIYVKF